MLLEEYGYETLDCSVPRSDAYQYLPKDSPARPTVLKESKRTVRVITVGVDGSPSVFVFKELGIDQRLPTKLEGALRENHKVPKITYVSLVMDGAKKEVLNYESVKDATPYISVKEFSACSFPKRSSTNSKRPWLSLGRKHVPTMA